MSGPAPKQTRRRRNVPARGEWRATPGIGWQHGPIPDHPGALRPETIAVWETWMKSWWASHWMPEDLPGLAVVIRLYELVADYAADPYVEKTTRKGDSIYVLKPNPASELRQMMDNYGITPKGQQDRRWVPPKDEPAAKPAEAPAGKLYGHLRAVGD